MDADTEIHQRLAGIDTMIDVAAQACALAPAASPELCECIARLDRQSDEATRSYLLGRGEHRLAQDLGMLEATGEQACALCGRQRSELAHLVTATLTDACQEIRDLRRQLHGG